MVRKRIVQAVFCSLVFCNLMCGCGADTGEVLFIGGEDEEIVISAGGETEGAAVTEPEEFSEIYVYVCGAVMNPGVVRLKEGSRAEDALEAAGGFREDAGTDYVNLAAKVTDGEKLYFPTADERAELEAEGSSLVNINTADAGTLCTLPGIGEARAADIIRYREASGPFETCEDIMKVPGIKTSVYSKISDLITVK